MNNVLDALSALEADAGVKERMARWIAESHSLGIDIQTSPMITFASLNAWRIWRRRLRNGTSGAKA